MRLISAGSLVRAQSGPAFAWSAAQSEGCHAGVKRRRPVLDIFSLALQDYGLASQRNGKIFLRLCSRKRG